MVAAALGVVLSGIALPRTASAAEILFGTSGAGGSASSLYTIDTGTGVATLVGPIGFSHVVSIDFDPLTGVLYGIENDGNTLITIDTATGVGTSTGVTVTGISQSPDMSFDSAGTLYTWSEPFPDHLNTVDLITGVTTDVGPSGLGTARLGLDVDSTDTIYVKNGDGGIYTVSATTGATTLVVVIGSSLGHNALAFDAADTLYTLDRTGVDSDLYTIDLTTGATTLIGSTGIASMAALAFGGDNCFVIDAIDDQGSVINDGTTADFLVLANDECSGDTPISVVELPGDLLPDRGGSATTDGDTVSYTPAAGFAGFEEFTYTAQDAGLEAGTAALFSAPTDFPAGLGPFSVAIADLDGDTAPDLVTANFSAGVVNVLLSNGDGTFGNPVAFATGSGPRSVAVADLDGDTIPDLVTANQNSDDVSVLLGNGDGSFLAAVSFAAGDDPRSVAVADLDGDTVPDLVTANFESHDVSVLLGNGDGSFQPAVSYLTTNLVVNFPLSVAIADLDGDTVPDLVILNENGETVSSLLGNGDGSFREGFKIRRVGLDPRSFAVADLDGDSVPDAVTVNIDGGDVSVLLGDGAGRFQFAFSFAAGISPQSIAIADFDGDTVPDLVTTDLSATVVHVLLGNGDGTFEVPVAFAAGPGRRSVAVADLDGDTAPDLVTANTPGNDVSVLLNRGGADPPTVDQDTATVVIDVLENLIPDAVDDVAAALENQATIIDVLANDSLGNAPSGVEIEAGPANGSATVQANDTIQYSPNFGFFGHDSFEYRLTDANGDSDVATVTVCVFGGGQLPIDIMPSDPGNNLNLRAGSGATISVAILSASGFCGAPNLVDPSTLRFGPGQAGISGSPRVRDVDGDGNEDLLVKFPTNETGIACGDTQASLSGRTFDSLSISGSDAINTFNCPRTRKRW